MTEYFNSYSVAAGVVNIITDRDRIIEIYSDDFESVANQIPVQPVEFVLYLEDNKEVKFPPQMGRVLLDKMLQAAMMIERDKDKINDAINTLCK